MNKICPIGAKEKKYSCYVIESFRPKYSGLTIPEKQCNWYANGLMMSKGL